MAFQVGVNSWISLTDANTYFSEIKDGSFWSGLSNAEKKILLITSFKWIRRSGYNIAPTNTTAIVKEAQCELAIEVQYRYSSDYKKRAALYASGVRSFNFNGWSESLAKAELPAQIKDLLKSFSSGHGGRFFEMTPRDY